MNSAASAASWRPTIDPWEGARQCAAVTSYCWMDHRNPCKSVAVSCLRFSAYNTVFCADCMYRMYLELRSRWLHVALQYGMRRPEE